MSWRNVVAMLAIPLVANAAVAQTSEREVSDLLLRINGPVHVAAGDSASTVWIVGNDAVIDGTVREQLLVINGRARITGTVRGDVTVMKGHLDLAPAARLGGNVLLYQSTLSRAPGAQIAGGVHDEKGFSFGARAVWFLWLSMTLFMLAVGLAFAWLAGRQLSESARLIGSEPGGTLLSGAVLWAGLPLLAFVGFLTIVGIPLAFAILFFLIPALTVVGYVVSATALGRAVLPRLGKEEARGPSEHPFAAAAAGLVLLQLVALIPGLGGLVLLLAGLIGAGALLYRLWLGRPRRLVAASGSARVVEAHA